MKIIKIFEHVSKQGGLNYVIEERRDGDVEAVYVSAQRRASQLLGNKRNWPSRRPYETPGIGSNDFKKAQGIKNCPIIEGR